MERNAYKTVDEYLKAAPEDKRAVLKKLRAAILSAAPKAEEKISYMIPAYIYQGKPLVYFAVQKKFCSFYAVGKTLLKKYKKELADFEISNTTIHFTPEHPLPMTLVKKIVKERMKENEALGGSAAKKKPAVRKRHRMPAFIKTALVKNRLQKQYDNRPPYQRNDYIGWITNAKLEETRIKRLKQMLDELKGGKKYMNMKYSGK